jgi:hypothetical protein
MFELPSSRYAGTDLGRRADDVATVDVQSIIKAGHGHGDRRAQLLPDATGRRLVLGHEVERVVVDASAAHASSYEAYAVVGGELKPLPVGASFDSRRGILYWQPGVGYTGDYDFAIVTDRHARIPVRVVLRPHASESLGGGRRWQFAFDSMPETAKQGI